MNSEQLFFNRTSLSDLIKPEMVIFNLQNKDKESVLREMVAHVHKSYQIEGDESIIERVLNRETISSTGVGNGYAFPHARIKFQNGPIICLGMAEGGIDFDAIDGKPVYIILLIIWKPQVPGLFNHLFGGVAKFLLDNPRVKEDLLTAKAYDQIVQILSPVKLDISSEYGHIQGAKLLLKLQRLLDEEKSKPGKAKLAKIKNEIKFIREELDPSILARFDRLYEKFGIGVFRIKDGVCQGCMIKLSTSLAAIILTNNNDIFVCQKCGRYVVG